MRIDRRFADSVPEARFLFGRDPVLVDGPSSIAFDVDVLALPVQRTRDDAVGVDGQP